MDMAKKKHLATHGPGKDHFTHMGQKISLVQPLYLVPMGNNLTNCPGVVNGMGGSPPSTGPVTGP